MLMTHRSFGMPQAETPAPQSHDMKSCSSLRNNQCAKYSMKLMGIGIEMIMKKYGLQLCIGKKTLYQRLIFSGSRKIIPAVCRPI